MRNIRVSGVACGTSPALNPRRSRAVVPGPPSWPSSCMVGVVKKGVSGGDWQCVELQSGDHAWHDLSGKYADKTNADYAALVGLKIINSAPSAQYTQNQIRLVMSAKSSEQARSRLATEAEKSPSVSSMMKSHYASGTVVHPVDTATHKWANFEEFTKLVAEANREDQARFQPFINFIQIEYPKYIESLKNWEEKAQTQSKSDIAEIKAAGQQELKNIRENKKILEETLKESKETLAEAKKILEQKKEHRETLLNEVKKEAVVHEANANEHAKTSGKGPDGGVVPEIPTSEPNTVAESELIDATDESEGAEAKSGWGFGAKLGAALTTLGFIGMFAYLYANKSLPVSKDQAEKIATEITTNIQGPPLPIPGPGTGYTFAPVNVPMIGSGMGSTATPVDASVIESIEPGAGLNITTNIPPEIDPIV